MKLSKKVSNCCNSSVSIQKGTYFCTHCIGICDIKKQTTNLFKTSIITLILVLIVNGSFEMSSVQQINRNYSVDCVKQDSVLPDVILTDSCLAVELTKIGCILPSVAVAQFKVETTYKTEKGFKPYSSPVCVKYKNLGGIRFKVSGSKGIGFSPDSLHYVIYNSYKDCLHDYVKIQNAYLNKIDGKYAEDPRYITVIKSMR